MSKNTPPIKRNALKALLEELFSRSSVSSFLLSSHVQQRMRERRITLPEIHSVLLRGKIIKEHPPKGFEAPDWRWEKIYQGITVIFKVTSLNSLPSVHLITCWRGNKPAGEII